MQKSGSRKIVLLGLIVLVIYMLSSSLLPSDRTRIKKLIEQGRVACEQEDIETLMSLFQLGYRDDMGLTYAAWKRLFGNAFETYDDIRIRIIELRIHVNDDGKEATATLSVRGEGTLASTKGKPDTPAYRPVGAADEAKLVFRKTPTGWKLHAVSNLRQDDW